MAESTACAATTPRTARCVATWCNSPDRAVSQANDPHTLAGLQDKGTSAENIQVITRYDLAEQLIAAPVGVETERGEIDRAQLVERR